MTAFACHIRFLNADKKEGTGGTGTVMFKGEDIVGARMAKQSIPLFASLAMSIERLAEVKTVVVTFVGGPPPDTFEVVTPAVITGVQQAYGVIGARKVSNTEMHLTTCS